MCRFATRRSREHAKCLQPSATYLLFEKNNSLARSMLFSPQTKPSLWTHVSLLTSNENSGMTIRIRDFFLFSFAVAISSVAIVQAMRFDRFDRERAGKHEWIVDGTNPNIDELLSEIEKHKWMDLNPKSFLDLIDQLNSIVATRLTNAQFYSNDIDDGDFRREFLRIDSNQSIGRGLLVLLHSFELDIAAVEGCLVIADNDDAAIAMTRIYDLPAVDEDELVANVKENIDADSWMVAGGISTVDRLWNDSHTQCKLIANAPRATHRKIESMIGILARRYGWRQFALWTTHSAANNSGGPSGSGSGGCYGCYGFSGGLP